MEEQELYRAILGAPHDDTARLVYADWLDENAERFPDPLARSERARAEFIRVQCALARLGSGGWKTGGPSDPELAKRQQRLILQHGRKWRRAFPRTFASSPFDRGFLRPFRALRPQEFLGQPAAPDLPLRPLGPPLSSDSPVLRYAGGGYDVFPAFPLWDVHLYASDLTWDGLADRGQYGDLLAEVGRSPALERVGWLKVSFFITPVFEFLRTGNFANVETLMLNSGPFSRVLEAVAENESFRSLRYVLFGGDWWAWAGAGPMSDRNLTLLSKITEANARHLPHGAMRTALRDILNGLPLPPIPAPVVRPLPSFGPAILRETMLTPDGELTNRSAWVVGLLCFALIVAVAFTIAPAMKELPPAPAYKFRSDPLPNHDTPEIRKALQQIHSGKLPPPPSEWKTPTTAPTSREKGVVGPRPEKQE